MKASFLAMVAEELVRRGGDYSALNIVFPQHRAIEVFGGIWAKKSSETAGRSPRLFTMSGLLRNNSGQKKADVSEMLFRIYNAYLTVCAERGNSGTMTLDEFLPWGEMMLGDFDDVDKSLADAASVFREVKNLRDIESMKFAEEESVRQLKEYFSTFYQAYGDNMRGKYHEVWNMLSAIYLHLNSEYERTAYEGAVYRKGCENMLKTAAGNKYEFVGFNVLSGAERRVMRHLKEQGRADFFWDYTPGFVDGDNIAVSDISANLKVFGGWIPPCEHGELSAVKIVESTTQSGEAAYVAKWLETVNPAKDDFTAIIPMDEGIVGMLHHFLPCEDFDFRIPCALAQTSVYAKLMRFVDAEMKNHENAEEYDGRTLIAALKKEIEDGIKADEDEDCHEEKVSLEAAKTAVNTVCALLEKNKDLKVSPRVAAMIFKSQYAAGVDEDNSGGSKTVSGGKRRVDVINLQDTRTIDFDNVLLLDCNEGSLPQTRRRPTMLPNAVRSAYGLPAQNNGSVAAYNFFRLLKRTPNISVAYSSSSTAMGSREMSRYILQMLAGQIRRNCNSETIVGKAVLRECVPQEVKKTPQMLQKIKSLEATPLYMYVECPLKFYYNKVARLRTPVPDAGKMPPNLFGTIFHDSIQRYYENKPSTHIERSTIEQDLADKRLACLSECVRKAFEDSKVEDNSVIRGIIMKYLKDVLRYDAANAPFDIVPQYIEKFLYVPFTSKSGYTVKVGGKFDRVHKKDGVHVVVDYKTGKWGGAVKAASLHDVFSKPDTQKHYNYMLQTLVYSLALDKGLRAAVIRPELYFITAMARDDFEPCISIDKAKVCAFHEMREEVREEVQRIVDDIFDLSKPFAPCGNGKVCAYCDYRRLCFRK